LETKCRGFREAVCWEYVGEGVIRWMGGWVIRVFVSGQDRGTEGQREKRREGEGGRVGESEKK
jgi:hypothetical protein